jgi:hypothetical protein
MTKVAVVKIEHEDALYRIPTTDVKEQYGKLQIFEGDKRVGEFRLDKIEHWSISEEARF